MRTTRDHDGASVDRPPGAPAIPIRVLLVEDQPDDALLLTRQLIAGGYEPLVHRVDTAEAMDSALRSQRWDLILSDYCLPCFDAPGALNVLKESGLDIPFIIVSGNVCEEVAVTAMKAGAHDYLSKGKLARLVPAIAREIREATARAQHRQLRDQCLRDAFHDPLTGLPNRVLFLDRLERAILSVKRRPSDHFAVLCVHLDRLKLISDLFGHLAGDQLLLLTAERLRSCVRPIDTIARIGGNEFHLLLESAPDRRHGEAVAEVIHGTLSQPCRLDGGELLTTVSIGLTTSFLGYDRPADVMRDADTALHQAKTGGRGGHVVFDRSMHAHLRATMEIENELHRAVQSGDFRLHYQPIISLPGSTVCGLEALLRWQRTPESLVSPAEFIEVAEDSGLIVPIGDWVLKTACRQLKAWQGQGLPARRVAVNISARQLLQSHLDRSVQEAVGESGLDPACLELELTESAIMENEEEAGRTLQRIRSTGVRLTLDDFGTGYSSLSLLRREPFDGVKIDRSFVRGLVNSGDDQAIIEAILALSRSLGLSAVAEGVETEGQLAALQVRGCEAVQGFLFSPPVPAETVPRLFAPQERPRHLHMDLVRGASSGPRQSTPRSRRLP